MTDSAQLNEKYFSEQAAVYDIKHAKTLDQLVREIRARKDFIGVQWIEEDDDEDDDDDDVESDEAKPEPARAVKLLDYACGTGVVSRALSPYLTQCVGVDISAAMAATYNTRAENQGLSRDEMHAYVGDLTAEDKPAPAELTAPEFYDFDIAAVGLGFHHFDNPELAAKRLAERLKPGGVLLILDFLPHGEMEHSHPATKTVMHHGFSAERVRKIFEDAGVGKDYAIEEVGDVSFRGHEDKRKLFMARGTKA